MENLLVCRECRFYREISATLGDCFGLAVSPNRRAEDCPELAYMPPPAPTSSFPGQICERCIFYRPLEGEGVKKGVCFDGRKVPWNKRATTCPHQAFRRRKKAK
jgi:hypothetical protein